MYLRGKDGYIIPLSQVRWDSPTISRWKDIVPGSVVNVNGAETNGRTAAIFTLPSCRSITQDAANSDMEPGALRILVGGRPISRPYGLPSSVVLIAARAFWRFETARPTAVFRTNDPLKPVRPACSEPKALIR